MADLSYSNEAENILSRFYGVDAIVYVEGVDDIPFWEHMFDTFSGVSVEIKDVGGRPQINKYISKIESGDINAVVACDADLSYAGTFSNHNNVLRSYGYSIENTMICEKSLRKAIRSIGKLPIKSIDENEISNWIANLASRTEALVVHDVANEILKKGIDVAVDNCTRFMMSKKSSEICPTKISNHLSAIDLKTGTRMESKIRKLIKESNRVEYDLLRGHFLFSASLRYVRLFISNLKKSVNISNDSFFGVIFIAFEAVFNSTHRHYNHYRDAVQGITLSP